MVKIKKPVKGEYCREKTAIKNVFFYSNKKDNLDVKSREVYNKKLLEIHFPFSRDGNQKYKYIETIEFDNISSGDVKGVYKSANFGLGFTKNLSPIIYELEKYPSIKKIIISSSKDSKINRFNIVFNFKDLEKLFYTLEPFKKKQSNNLKKISNNELHKIFPKKFKFKGDGYSKNDLSLYIKTNQISQKDMSQSDVDSIIDLIPEKINEYSILYLADEKINHLKLEKIKNDFKKLNDQKTDTKQLENKCQIFLVL
ncbi:MAG: hypothetical protein K9M44_02345 [Candidatus Pacebacteria bacterium]|nr:hypothetical protein [Candidatus Paceibacterota bacterium]